MPDSTPTAPTVNELALALKIARVASGKSQCEMAHIMGVTSARICQIEGSGSYPRKKMFPSTLRTARGYLSTLMQTPSPSPVAKKVMTVARETLNAYIRENYQWKVPYL